MTCIPSQFREEGQYSCRKCGPKARELARVALPPPQGSPMTVARKPAEDDQDDSLSPIQHLPDGLPQEHDIQSEDVRVIDKVQDDDE